MPTYAIRNPKTDDELWEYMRTVFNTTIPRERVCEHHSTPFDAFAEAFFARAPMSVWKASRGFGGKSHLLGALCIAEATILGAEETVLGGSSAQSLNVQRACVRMLEAPLAPKSLLAKEPTSYNINFSNGGHITALTASPKSVRGPHPQRLRLDEIDEMDLELFDSSLGQPMEAYNYKGELVPSQVVASSTHQHPDKTMTEVLNRAKKNGWPLHEWCWRESVGTNEKPGWLKPRDVMTKRQQVTSHMWEIEYDLQEPAFDGRAITSEKVDLCFNPERGTYEGDMNEWIQYMPPAKNTYYITGVDWAKEHDFTVIRTFMIDQKGLHSKDNIPRWIEVSFLRTGRKPWPEMISDVMRVIHSYPGMLVHDATGIGNVLQDMIEERKLSLSSVVPITLHGENKTTILNDWVMAIERHQVESPRIEFSYNEHKYATIADLFGVGHTPDSIIAGAIAWNMRQRMIASNISPIEISKDTRWSSTDQTLVKDQKRIDSDLISPSRQWGDQKVRKLVSSP